ncbi:hypothetical protein [uncultured Anaerococcus sp.]|uniref:hypothetical protein n=1 Tax=uncultured Anaerococcus sp. TaxID=293428 RepID=UPI00288BF7F4|nr:hypothetical protein [uncultured Anaerococcus sp.]
MSKTDDLKEKISKKVEILESVSKILSLVGSAFVSILGFLHYADIIKASDFYGIPVDYFIDNAPLYSLFSKIVILILPLIFFLLPAIYKQFFKNLSYTDNELKMLSFSFCMLLLILFLDWIIKGIFFVFPSTTIRFKINAAVIFYFVLVCILSYLHYEYYLSKIFEVKKNERDVLWSQPKVYYILLIFSIIILLRSMNISNTYNSHKKYNAEDKKIYQLIITNKIDKDNKNYKEIDKIVEQYSEIIATGDSDFTYYEEISLLEKLRSINNEFKNKLEGNYEDASSDDKLDVDVIIIRNDKDAVTIKGYIDDNKLHILKGQYRMDDISNKEIINIETGIAEIDIIDLSDLVEKYKNNN